MALLPNLQLICLTGPQVQGVDLAETARRNITVIPGPDVQAPERADYVVATLLGLCRQWPEADRFVRNSDWVDGPYPPAHRFSGLRVGLVGFDSTAKALLPRLAAFGIGMTGGNLTVVLIATDSTGVTPQGWTYEVTLILGPPGSAMATHLPIQTFR